MTILRQIQCVVYHSSILVVSRNYLVEVDGIDGEQKKCFHINSYLQK